MISRNDPCWCGSGRKYKTCHKAMDDKLEVLKREGHIVPRREIIHGKKVIEGVRASAEITKDLFRYLEDKIAAGVKTIEIDQMVHEFTLKRGGIPATLGYNGYPKSCCTSINDTVCHGIPDETVIKEGDIINVDLTTILDGYFSDSSRMYMIGEVSDKAKRIVEETHTCMMKGIEAVKPYECVERIAEAIESYANSKGYSVVEALGGHGIGVKFHEDPHIHHYTTGSDGMVMVPGMIFTIEPMINEKDFDVVVLDDDWTVKTIDGGLSAQWEHTILVTDEGAEIITLL